MLDNQCCSKNYRKHRCDSELKSGGYASIRKDLRHVNWELDSGRSVHELWYAFKNLIETVIKRHVPFKKLHAGRHKKVMWMTAKAVRAALADPWGPCPPQTGVGDAANAQL